MKILSFLFLSLFSLQFWATTCPDPDKSTLAQGIVPSPWLLSPFSPKRPTNGGKFFKANILVAGYGRGIVCNYQLKNGVYIIWWPVIAKIPPRSDNQWRDTLGGFECTASLSECVFYP